MKKSEIEQHDRMYRSLLSSARTAIEAGRITQALNQAEKTWPHFDGMIVYEKRIHGRDQVNLESAQLILKYAPVVFDDAILNRLEAFLTGKRRILKASRTDLSEGLSRSRKFLWACWSVWDVLERADSVPYMALRSEFTGNEPQWQFVVEIWTKLGALSQTGESDRCELSLVTRFDRIVSAKCPACGAVASLARHEVLRETPCPRCRRSSAFVELSQPLFV